MFLFFLQIKLMSALNHKRVANRIKELACKEVEKFYQGLASSLQLGVMFSKASDDWSFSRSTYFLELTRYIKVESGPSGALSFQTQLFVSSFLKVRM